MKKKYVLSAPLLMLVILISVLALLPTEGVANAVGDTEVNLQLTSALATPNVQYYNKTEGCTYNYSFYEYEDQLLDRVSYSVYQVDFDNETIVNDNGEYVAEPVVCDNVTLVDIEVPTAEWRDGNDFDPYTRARRCGFSVTVHEWCAIVVKVEWTEGGQPQEAVYNGADGKPPLFCTNIDCSVPDMKFVDGPIYIEKSFLYTVRISGNTYGAGAIRSARSPFKSIRVFRVIDDVEEDITVLTTFKNTDQLVTAVDVRVQRGAYYITAVDMVGNTTTMKVAQIDYDIDEIVRINSTENILSSTESYSDELISNLSKAYYSYLAIKNDKTASESDVLGAQNTYETALSAVLKADAAKNDGSAYSYEVLNEESYFAAVKAENFNVNSYPNIKIGDTAKLQLSLASFDVVDMDETIKGLAGEVGAMEVLAVSCSLSTGSRGGVSPIIFSSPVEIVIPMREGYSGAVAYAKVQNGEKVSYEKLAVTQTPSTAVVEIKNSNAKVYFFYTQGAISNPEKGKNENLLWLLFLLVIPVGVGAFFAVRLIKKKRAENR